MQILSFLVGHPIPTLIALLVGLVFYYYNRYKAAKDKAAVLESGQSFRDALTKEQSQEEKANEAEDHYRALRDHFLNDKSSDGDGEAK